MTSNFERFHEIQNKQILKVTALYVIWNPKSVKCPASISENPVPLFEYKKFVDNAQQCFAFTPQANFPAHNLNFH